MKLEYLSEPRLQFAEGEHICPRRGIMTYGTYDKLLSVRRSEVIIGAVGTTNCSESLEKWLNRCKSEIAPPEDANQHNLRVPFCGVNLETGFGIQFRFNQDLVRTIRKAEVDDLLKIASRKERIERTVDLFYENIKFLAQNRPVDVIVCVIPANLHKSVSAEEKKTLTTVWIP